MFLIGFVFEAVSDWQMAEFKTAPTNRGKILESGLWSYSRHPNYFGEILIWWGMAFLSFSVERGVLSLLSPLLMTFLLTRVSGVPMLDRLLKDKGAAFQKYVGNVPALLPFRFRQVRTFFAVAIVLLVLDSLWLGFCMGDFYRSQLLPFMGLHWDVHLWAAVGVYFFLTLGIVYFAIADSKSTSQSVFRGAMLGLSIYAVYEYTNLAMLPNWPTEMALVDLAWGTALCAIAAGVGSFLNRIPTQSI